MLSTRHFLWLVALILLGNSAVHGLTTPSNAAEGLAVANSASGCTVTHNAEKTVIPLGEQIEIAGRIAHCERYDGHPILIFSAAHGEGASTPL